MYKYKKYIFVYDLSFFMAIQNWIVLKCMNLCYWVQAIAIVIFNEKKLDMHKHEISFIIY